MNPILPILHRPTFVKNVADGLHLRDENFAATLLFVLAVASCHSDDPRVLADPSSRLSAGWTFIESMPVAKKVLLRPPCLNDIQQTLAVVYSFGTCVPEFTWMVVGLGLRYVVEIGLHRKKPKGHKSTVDDELKKRSFWALVTLDRLISLYKGRPIMMQEEDFDVELPVECDDEYWDICSDGEVRFCQPGNKPSKISYFNAQIQLSGIMSVVVRNLYSIKKRQGKLGLPRKDRGDKIISDIDSSMNAWMNSIPDHLRWDPDRDNKIFLYQSSVLYSTYHMLQIYTHRPFLRSGSSLSTPSPVSAMAARSCSRILQVHLTRLKIITPHLLIVAFISGTVLAMNIWSGKRVGHPAHAEDLAGYEQCLATFTHASDTWMIAGLSLKMFKGM
ncbi:fungal-specific transcription factor domain-containing protein, partial [Armillaria luteobubalina]